MPIYCYCSFNAFYVFISGLQNAPITFICFAPINNLYAENSRGCCLNKWFQSKYSRITFVSMMIMSLNTLEEYAQDLNIGPSDMKVGI